MSGTQLKASEPNIQGDFNRENFNSAEAYNAAVDLSRIYNRFNQLHLKSSLSGDKALAKKEGERKKLIEAFKELQDLPSSAGSSASEIVKKKVNAIVDPGIAEKGLRGLGSVVRGGAYGVARAGIFIGSAVVGGIAAAGLGVGALFVGADIASAIGVGEAVDKAGKSVLDSFSTGGFTRSCANYEEVMRNVQQLESADRKNAKLPGNASPHPMGVDNSGVRHDPSEVVPSPIAQRRAAHQARIDAAEQEAKAKAAAEHDQPADDVPQNWEDALDLNDRQHPKKRDKAAATPKPPPPAPAPLARDTLSLELELDLEAFIAMLEKAKKLNTTRDLPPELTDLLELKDYKVDDLSAPSKMTMDLGGQQINITKSSSGRLEFSPSISANATPEQKIEAFKQTAKAVIAASLSMIKDPQGECGITMIGESTKEADRGIVEAIVEHRLNKLNADPPLNSQIIVKGDNTENVDEVTKAAEAEFSQQLLTQIEKLPDSKATDYATVEQIKAIKEAVTSAEKQTALAPVLANINKLGTEVNARCEANKQVQPDASKRKMGRP